MIVIVRCVYDFDPDQLHLLKDPARAVGDSVRLGIEHQRPPLALPVLVRDGGRNAELHGSIKLLDHGIPRAWVAQLRAEIPRFFRELVDLRHW